MSAGLVDALQDCLERIEAGASASEAMARFPGLRDKLEPRLMAARTVRAHRPPMPTAARAALRVRLTALDTIDGHGEPRRVRWRIEWRRAALLAAGALAALVLVLGGLHGVSASSRPGDALYPVKVGIERLRGAVLEYADALDPDLGAREGASGVYAEPTPSPTATAVARQPADRGAPTEPLGTAPSAPTTVPSGPTAPYEDVESKPGGPALAVPDATVTLTPGVGPSATEDLGASSPTATFARPTLVPAAALPVPTEYPQASTGAIEGTVSGPDGEPVEGASVIVQTVHFAMPGGAGPGQLKATTDSAGRYRIDGVPSGTHLVFVRVGHRIAWYPGRMDRHEADEVRVDPGQTTSGVDIRMDQLDSGSRGRQRDAPPP